MPSLQKPEFCAMQILLCAATEMEIAPTLQVLSKRSHPVQFLITGVGLLASTYALTRAVITRRPDMILQAGVAGSLNPELPLAQTVLVKSECVGDLGVQENGRFHSPFDMRLIDANAWPWQDGRLPNGNKLLSQMELAAAEGVTVNQITTSPQTILRYQNKLNVEVESMEGAALHYIGLAEKIPFLQIRSLSNFIGERDKSKWRLNEAIKNLNREVQLIIAKLETT